MNWTGVMPALTTAFDEALRVNLDFVRRHAEWQIENGVNGLVALGSLGEGATLELDEKLSIIDTLVSTTKGKVPVVATVSALSTADAVALARAVEVHGARGLMILPPYVYKGDWREMKAHVAAVLDATSLPAMLYNNPIAYGTDFLPEQIEELAKEFANLKAVKESSADVRRVSAIRSLLGDRLAIFIGVDDAIVEGIAAGAVGWVAGLVNALPRESVELFELAHACKVREAFELNRWFLPLLRMDTVPKFIQLIKQVQEEMHVGCARVRGPRLQIVGEELAQTRAILQFALVHRPSAAKISTLFPK